MGLQLKVVAGPQAGSILTGAIPSVLGRKEADILILDQMVSKRHATIQMINGKLVVIDLNSTNGTTLNGEKVGQREIKIGDRLGLGQSVMVLESVTF
jgi:pSer/pThr/pTyr-binding forkhead associated (FHA) protein